MGVFKTLFLKKDTLALTYDGAYVGQHKAFSDVSTQWLEYLSHPRKIEITHAVNQGEHQMGPYFVDGIDLIQKSVMNLQGVFTMRE